MKIFNWLKHFFTCDICGSMNISMFGKFCYDCAKYEDFY